MDNLHAGMEALNIGTGDGGVPLPPEKRNDSPMHPQVSAVGDLPPRSIVSASRIVYNCNECPKGFFDKNELINHELTHLPLTVPSLACDRKFSTYFGMIIHLEAGTCTSGTKLQKINKLATQCFQWKKYIDKSFRSQLLEGNDSYRREEVCSFRCPTCETDLPLLSSLFQHVWSPACPQGKNGGAIKKLKRWLAKRLYRFKR